MKERKARVEDALHATRAAIESGIVPGGGVALIRASAVLEKVRGSEGEQVGIEIVRKALEAPAKTIAENAGFDGAVTANKIRNGKGAFGFNAETGEYTDLIKAGVIDPAKVTKCALQNAASVATLLLTSDALIADAPKDDEKKSGGGGGYDDMY